MVYRCVRVSLFISFLYLEYFELEVITIRQNRNAENNQVKVDEKRFVIETIHISLSSIKQNSI
jgi:hypothetical protein